MQKTWRRSRRNPSLVLLSSAVTLLLVVLSGLLYRSVRSPLNPSASSRNPALVAVPPPQSKAPPVKILSSARSKATRVVFVSFGVGEFQDPTIPTIQFAEPDVVDVYMSLRPLVGTLRLRSDQTYVLCNADATSARMREAFNRLETSLAAGRIRPGDSVLVMIESHLVGTGMDAYIAGHDSVAGGPAATELLLSRISEVLGMLAHAGCQVIVLLDVVHPRSPPGMDDATTLREWARELQTRRLVAVVLASSQGPSMRGRGHGIFAECLLETFRSDTWKDEDFSFFRFFRLLQVTGLENSRRKQRIANYLPETILSEFDVIP